MGQKIQRRIESIGGLLVSRWQRNPSAALHRKLFDEESIEHKKEIEGKFKDLVNDFANYKNHLKSLYEDHYEEIQLDNNNRPITDPQTKKPLTRKVRYDDLYRGVGEFSDKVRESDP